MLELARLKELFVYDPETGWFTNRSSRGRAGAGKRAGAYAGHSYCYRRIIIDYKKYYEHHLAWFYVYGEWPDEIDHIDGDGSNNALANLRACSRSQNNCHRTSQGNTNWTGLRGAYLDKRNLQWFSKIQIGKKVKYLGSFSSAEEAHKAFEVAAAEAHGEFYTP